MMPTSAIILAGGMGTRLRSVVPELPKPLAPVCGQPFLLLQLYWLASQGIRTVTISTGYRGDLIESALGREKFGIRIDYVREPAALGTGGAVQYCMSKRENSKNPIWIVNGDTIFDVSLQAVAALHLKSAAWATLALCELDQPADRTEFVQLDQNRIVSLGQMKVEAAPVLIVGGVTLIEPDLFNNSFPVPPFSFERELLASKRDGQALIGFRSRAYFLDIGIPADYYQAQVAPIFIEIAAKIENTNP